MDYMEIQRKISVIGLGYVGLPVAVAFGKITKVIGYDIDAERITQLNNNYDRNNEISSEELETANVFYTNDSEYLKAADFHIVTIPTPVTNAKQPDFDMLNNASKTLAKLLKKNDIVVYESTVYPGATEEVMCPILERYSGLKCGKDFFIGYTPERINPGDRDHLLTNTPKIVSGMNPEILDIIAKTYEKIVPAGVYRVSSIKIAEAAKVLENTQRDLNVSLINEAALIFNKLNIDTNEVIQAASTKWNFMPYKPGLVGGHCIGVDPYYLAFKAITVGYQPDVILAGRRINELMGRFVAEQSIKNLIKAGKKIRDSRIAILGITFKENCNDIRNTRVLDIINELHSYGVKAFVHDPIASPEAVKKAYKIDLVKLDDLADMDGIIIAVAHDQFKNLPAETFKNMLNENGIIMDVKSILNPQDFTKSKISLWRL